MAKAVSDRVSKVYALDVSRGVLECAKVLNGGKNLHYLQPILAIGQGFFVIAYTINKMHAFTL